MSNKKKVVPYNFSNNFVVVKNIVFNCYRNLTLDEERLFVIAAPKVRNNDLFNQEQEVRVTITIKEFAEACNIDHSTAYNSLRDGAERFSLRVITYVDEQRNIEHNRNWLTGWDYDRLTGTVEMIFSKAGTEILRNFDNTTPYTKYPQIHYKIEYSYEMMHLAFQYLSVGYHEMLNDEIIAYFDMPKSCQTLHNMKRKLDKAILEVNNHTDLHIILENLKNGRKVIGRRFIFEKKNIKNVSELAEPEKKEVEDKPDNNNVNDERDNNTVDMFTGFSDYEINYVFQKPLSDAQISRLYHHRKQLVKFNKHLLGKDDKRDVYDIFMEWRPKFKVLSSLREFKMIKALLNIEFTADDKPKSVKNPNNSVSISLPQNKYTFEYCETLAKKIVNYSKDNEIDLNKLFKVVNANEMFIACALGNDAMRKKVQYILDVVED